MVEILEAGRMYPTEQEILVTASRQTAVPVGHDTHDEPLRYDPAIHEKQVSALHEAQFPVHTVQPPLADL